MSTIWLLKTPILIGQETQLLSNQNDSRTWLNTERGPVQAVRRKLTVKEMTEIKDFAEKFLSDSDYVNGLKHTCN